MASKTPIKLDNGQTMSSIPSDDPAHVKRGGYKVQIKEFVVLRPILPLLPSLSASSISPGCHFVSDNDGNQHTVMIGRCAPSTHDPIWVMADNCGGISTFHDTRVFHGPLSASPILLEGLKSGDSALVSVLGRNVAVLLVQDRHSHQPLVLHIGGCMQG